MSPSPSVSPLHVADEAFLVASTIERCPKTMMLRELVMNALEAAGEAPPGSRNVELRAVRIDGTPKLRIWNTGPGMTAAELHAICDLASSLHKETGLDRNFGMGAKVASLPSNRHGLRYRSCRAGTVSQVMLGQRDGIYGRLIQHDAAGAPAEVIDVTEACQAEEGYDLSADWTEVVLLGNRPGQDTTTAPYDGNPAVEPHWAVGYLARRFHRLPPGIAVTLAPELAGGTQPLTFRARADRLAEFDRMETVDAGAGIRIHYGFDPPAGTGTLTGTRTGASPFGSLGGMGCIVHRGETYGLREGPHWLLDAPTHGIPYGARFCAVIVELPDDYGVRPEAYRQFLRFKDGDQRQVLLGDFATLIRARMPGWLARIIESFGPPPADYMGEVSSELAELLKQLGVAPQWRGPAMPRGAEPSTPPPPAAERKPPPERPPAYEKPPEIIGLTDDALLAERQLHGRAARYYPQSHQLFVNLTYPSVARMAAQLEQEFETAPDRDRMTRTARDLAEWAITRKVSRALVHSLAKRAAGWAGPDVERAQSPESLSLAADDFALLMAPARRRMAESLGLQPPRRDEEIAGSLGARQRAEGERAEAEQAARRALATQDTNAAPLLRRISEIEQRRNNLTAALDWAERAAAAAPDDPHSHLHLSRIHLQQRAFAAAEAASRRALELAQATGRSSFLRHMSLVAAARKDFAAAQDWARQAVREDPGDPWSHANLAHVLAQQNDLDGAERALSAALDCEMSNAAPFLQQLSMVELRRRHPERARELAAQAIAADPSSPRPYATMANLLMQAGELDAAERNVLRALGLGPSAPAPFLRQLGDIEARRGNLEQAVAMAEQAVAADPNDPWSHYQRADLLLKLGRLDQSAAAAQAALSLGRHNPAPFLRRLSEVEVLRHNPADASELARQAVEADRSDPWSHSHLARVLMQEGDLAGARQAAMAALAVGAAAASPFMRQLSQIEARSDLPAALHWAQQAVAADPGDPWSHHHLSGLLLANGDAEAAESAAVAALSLGTGDAAAFTARLDAIRRSQQQATA